MLLRQGVATPLAPPQSARRQSRARSSVRVAALFGGPSREEHTALQLQLKEKSTLLAEALALAGRYRLEVEALRSEKKELERTCAGYLERVAVAEKEQFGLEKRVREEERKLEAYSVTAERQIKALAEALKRAGGTL